MLYLRDGGDLLRDRIKARRISEKMVPVSKRSLAECLNPQPKAQKVMQRLLKWIDRADVASQSGAARPAFQDEFGEPIFPKDDEDLWWLTELQRGKQNANKADEDGPPSSDEGCADDGADDDGEAKETALTDDEDPLSDVSEVGIGEEIKLQPPSRNFRAEAFWQESNARLS